MRWLALVLVALAGCTPSHLDLKPRADEVIVEKDMSFAARVRVPESGAGGVDLVARSNGVDRRGSGNKKSVAVSFLIDAENRSELDTAAIDVAAAELVDAAGNRLVPLPSSEVGTTDETTVKLAPGERRTLILDFATVATHDPRDLLPASLRIPVVQGHDERRATFVFERAWNPYYGGYRWYPGGFYTPYYGFGPPYGPWWGWGWGGGWYF